MSTPIQADFAGLARAFSVMGGVKGLSEIRTQEGIYVFHDVADYLSREQTIPIMSTATVDTVAGAGNYTASVPSSAGLAQGRYLVNVAIQTTSLANLTGWGALLSNSGKVTGIPAFTGYPILSGANTGRTFAAATWLIPDASPTRLPIWCPAGSFVQLSVNMAAAGGIFEVRAVWHTTEGLNSAGAPVGLPGAPVKI